MESIFLVNNFRSIKWDKSIFIIILSIIILIPIAIFPYCINVFNPPKELLFEVLSISALIIWGLKTIFIDNFRWHVSYLDRPVSLYLLVGCFSLIWSVNIYHSIMALPLFLASPLLYFLITNSIYEKAKIDRIILVIIIVGIGMSIYGLLQYIGIDFLFLAGNEGRMEMFSLLGNVNYFAEYLILPLSLCFGLIISRKSGFNIGFLLMAFVVMGITLFLTFTRSSYLGIAFSFTLIPVFHIVGADGKLQKKYYLNILSCLLLLSILVSAVIYIPNPLNQGDSPLALLRNRVSIDSLTSGGSILRRMATWKFTWMIIEDYPVLGSGLGTYDYQTLKYQAEFFSRGNNRDIYPHGFAAQAHNEYLQLWSELGIVGLLLFMCIVFAYYRSVLKNIKRMDEKAKTITIGLVGGVTAVLVDAFFGFPLQLPASVSLFWIFLGLTSAQINITNTDDKAHIYQNHKNQDNIKSEKINTSNTTQNKAIVFKKLFLSFLVIVFMIVSVSFLIRPFLSRVYWYYGNKQIALENYNTAIKLYEQGLNWNPWQGEMYYDIGKILASKDINKTALEYFHKAERYVDHHKLPQNIAIAYLKLGEIKAAIPYLEKAIKYQTDKEGMLPFQLELGNIYLLHKDYINAEHLFNEIITNNPGNFETYYVLAGLYINQGKKEQAIKALEKVIEIAPGSKEADYAKTTLIKLEQEK